jgi:LppP/LprE lipoprotein
MRPGLFAAVAAALVAAAVVPAAAGAAVPSRAKARAYAHRTYIVQFGQHRRFALAGPRHTVRARDGSRISAWAMMLADSGDGTGQAVELFRGRRFLGWASAYDTVHLRVARHGHAIGVRYGVYRGNDPFCCPSSTRTVHYRWNGSRIVADGRPPKIFGHRGSRLHLAARSGAVASASRVVGCHRWASYPNVLVSSARNMTCRAAARDIRRTRKGISRRFRTAGGFRCSRVSGGALGGQWRCVRGRRAYRFEFGD